MPDVMSLLPVALILLGIGAFAGILAGLLGVGGGIVLVPAFYYAFSGLGYDHEQLMQICLATSLATIIFTSLRSLSSHHKKGAVEWDILKTWSIGIVIGALLGVFIATGLRSETLLWVFGILGICIGIYMAFGKSEWVLAEAMPEGIKRAVISPVIGFLSVLMGIGGGSFGVPLMTLHSVPIHRAVATASGFGVIIAFPSGIGFLLANVAPENLPPYTLGYVNIPAFLIVISMTMFTAPLGAKLAHSLDPKPLKMVFAFFLVLVALNMLRQAMF